MAKNLKKLTHFAVIYAYYRTLMTQIMMNSVTKVKIYMKKSIPKHQVSEK